MSTTTANPEQKDDARAAARTRLQETGRNEPCPCGSGKKYKKCHLATDEAALQTQAAPPDPMVRVNNGWRLFEQRRPGAAEKEFRAALALAPGLPEAQVGVGMAKLSAGETEAARAELAVVVKGGEEKAAELRGQSVKDGFNRRETQPYLRAAHALGCLAYDEERFEEALADLERVYTLDEGAVGTEARLITGKTLVKLGRAADAVPVLEGALPSSSASRAQMGLVLALFAAGRRADAEAALDKALAANPHFGKAMLGKIRRRVDNVLGSTPGSLEEAVVYSQTYGDVWDAAAKAFLEEALAARGEPSASGGAQPRKETREDGGAAEESARAPAGE
jgi:tetratricopeptide (TPR) repeat protein